MARRSATIVVAKTEVRWWPAVVILASGAILSAAVQFSEFQFSGRPTVDIGAIIGVSGAALFWWLMFFSRLRPLRRVQLLASSIAITASFGVLGFVDGFGGDGRPILTLRFHGSPERSFEKPRGHVSNPLAAQSQRQIDLSVTGLNDFPQFRGPDRSGVLHGIALSRDWAQSPVQELWRQPVGPGWSSFAVVGNYCVTQEQREDDEAVVCYDLSAGFELWEHRDRGRFHEVMGGDGPRATPTIDGGNVYALGATGRLNCLNGATGQAIWTRNILEDAGGANSPFGMAGSPLVVHDLVVVCPGGKGCSLTAYDRATGARRWAAGDSRAAYSSPVAATLAGKEQILIFNADGLFAHDMRDGHVLWSQPWLTPPEFNNVCQPIPLAGITANEPDRVFVASGYQKGCGLLDVARSADHFDIQVRWANTNLKPKFTSVVVRNGFVYGLDERILTCIDLSTGSRCWKGGRYGNGQLILVDDLLLIQAESGEVALVEASPARFQELGRFAALKQRTWNHPALAGWLLLVRNDREAACYALPLAKKM